MRLEGAAAILVSLCALSAPAGAEDRPIMGQLLAVLERLPDGHVWRISDTVPDGEELRPGDYLFAEDRVGLSDVSVVVEICKEEEKHAALASRIQLEIPASCDGVESSAGSDAGSSYAALDDRHVVAAGESLYTIARKYNITAQDIIVVNGMSSPDKLYVGQKLIIPGMGGTSPLAAPAVGSPVVVASVGPRDPANALQPPVSPLSPFTFPELSSTDERFALPVEGRLIVDFAKSEGTGVNVSADMNAPVRAAAGGQVIYSGSGVEGYGNLILIRHPNGYVSAYAHLSGSLVQKGTVVARGDVIGTVGESGSVTKPQLHFELRKGATPIDPLLLLADSARWLAGN